MRVAGLDSDVGVLGYVKPTEPLLWRADAVVLLSNAEGLPQVLIQAAAAGVPFVSYDVDGGREVRALGADGDVVPLGRVSEAADALVRLVRRRTGHPSGGPAVLGSGRHLFVVPALVGDVVSEVRRAG